MSAADAFSAHRAVWRQPWQTRRGQRAWQHPLAGPAVVTLAVLGLVAMWPARWVLWTGLGVAVWLVWLGWLFFDGLHRQNRPALARLVPGHAQALRVQLLAGAVLLTAAAVAWCTLVLGPGRPWLWLMLPAVVLLVWLPREPWLWLFPLAWPSLPLQTWAAEASAAAPGLKLLALLAAAGLAAASIGQGGPLHRWQDARSARWRRAAAAQREGRATPVAALGGVTRKVLRLFDWPQRLWRRQVLARGAQAPLAARLDLGLGLGGQWAALLWVALLLCGGLALVFGLRVVREGAFDLPGTADVARFGLCVGAYSMIGSTLYGRLTGLWARRREQALLALLPGVPATGLALLERRWRREYLLMWLPATALVLGVGAAGSPGSLDYTAACAALCLPLAWLAQHRQRRLQGRPQVAPLALAPVLAALLAWPVQQLGVPAAASLAAGVLVYAALAWRRDPQALSLPLGRRGGQPDTIPADTFRKLP